MFFGRPWCRYLPLISVMGTIFFLSHQPGDTIVLLDVPNIDKLLHSLVYGVLAASTLYAVPERIVRQYPWRTGVLVVLFCLAYGLSDEFHQSFIPGRFPSVWDIAADTMGAIVVVCLWLRWSASRRATREKDLIFPLS